VSEQPDVVQGTWEAPKLQPALSASRAAWVAHALGKGAQLAPLARMTRAQIITMYGRTVR
jgi:hypothetical protein